MCHWFEHVIVQVRQAGWQHSCDQLLVEGTAEPYRSVVRVGKE